MLEKEASIKRYRELNERKDLILDLQKRIKEGSRFNAWQRSRDKVGESRRIYEMKLFSILPSESKVILEALVENFEAGESDVFYFISRDESCAFMGVCSEFKDGFISIEFPQSITLAEYRQHERKDFSLNDRFEVDFYYKDVNGKKSLGRAPVLNISNGGICLYLSRETLTKLEKSNFIVLPNLKGFSEDIVSATASVSYSRTAQKPKLNLEEHLAVGFEFDERCS